MQYRHQEALAIKSVMLEHASQSDQESCKICMTNRAKQGNFWELTRTEFAAAIRTLDTQKSPGNDGVTHELMLALEGRGWEYLYRCYYTLIKYGQFPKIGLEIILAPVGKTSSQAFTESLFRPVSLLSVFAKIWEVVQDRRLNLWLEGYSWDGPHQLPITEPNLPRYSLAYRKNYCKEFGAISIIEFLFSEEGLEASGLRKFLLLNDNEAGFDVVSHQVLIESMEKLGVPQDLICATVQWLSYRQVRIKTGKRSWILSPGMPQGSPYSGGCFNCHNCVLIKKMEVINGDGAQNQFSDDNSQCGTGDQKNVDRLKKELVQAGRESFIFFEESKSEAVFYDVGISKKVEISDASRSLGFFYDGTWDFCSHFEITKRRMVQEYNSVARLKNLRVTQKVDVYVSLVYSAILSNSVPFFPYFKKSNKLQLQKDTAKFLKNIYMLPRQIPSTLLHRCAGIPDINTLMAVESLMLFYKGIALKQWAKDKVPSARAAKLLDSVNSTCPAKFLYEMDKKHLQWTEIVRALSEKFFPDIHALFRRQQLYIGKVFWRGVNLDARSMDRVGKDYGLGKLSGLKGGALNIARHVIAADHNIMARSILRQSPTNLVSATDGLVDKERNLGVGAGASWWWEPVGLGRGAPHSTYSAGAGWPVMRCEEEITTEAGDDTTPEPLLVSGCYITASLEDVAVDSFDAECFGLIEQLKEIHEHLEKRPLLRKTLRSFWFFLDSNSIVQALECYDDSSNPMIHQVMKILEMIKVLCVGISPNGEEEVWFHFRWTPGHAKMALNDCADFLTNAFHRAWADGHPPSAAQVQRKWMTAPILRRLLVRRVLEDKFKKCCTLPEYMKKRAIDMGRFRPPVGTFPNKEAEMLYFWIWLGYAPSPHLGCGDVVYENGTCLQKCKFCNRQCPCAVDHALFECEKLEVPRLKHLGFACRPPSLGLNVLKSPQKILRFVIDADTKLTHEFYQKKVGEVIDDIGTSIEKKQKCHMRSGNVFQGQKAATSMKVMTNILNAKYLE